MAYQGDPAWDMFWGMLSQDRWVGGAVRASWRLLVSALQELRCHQLHLHRSPASPEFMIAVSVSMEQDVRPEQRWSDVDRL